MGKIKPNGEIAAETKGIKGKKCKEYMEIMSKFLDAKIVDSNYTKEYYEEETEKVKLDTVQDILEKEEINTGKK